MIDAKRLGALADEYFRLHKARLAKDKEAEKAKEKESQAREALLISMRDEQIRAIGGTDCTVKRVTKVKPRVVDWPALWGHIQRTGEFDLLHKRVTDKAVTDRWEDKVTVPGVDQMQIEVLSITDKE